MRHATADRAFSRAPPVAHAARQVLGTVRWAGMGGCTGSGRAPPNTPVTAVRTGVSGFAASSAAIGLAGGIAGRIPLVIAFRALQGAFGGIVQPPRLAR